MHGIESAVLIHCDRSLQQSSVIQYNNRLKLQIKIGLMPCNIRPLKKKFSLSPFQLKNAMRAGGFLFFIFYIFFVCPSPAAAAYFKAIKQSINKTKLLFYR